MRIWHKGSFISHRGLGLKWQLGGKTMKINQNSLKPKRVVKTVSAAKTALHITVVTAVLALLGSSQADAYLRTVHAISGGPAVDVYVDDVLVNGKLEFMGVSDFVLTSSAQHTVRISTAGKKDVLLETEVEMSDDFGYTLELIKTADALDSNLVAFNFTDLEKDKALISIYHLVPVEGSVNVKPDTGLEIFEGIAYLDASTVNVAPYKGALALNDSGKKTLLIKSPALELAANKMYSIFAFAGKSGMELKWVEDVLK
jgi:hypothetical protein